MWKRRSAVCLNRSLAPAFQATVGVDHPKWKQEVAATMRAFLCLALFVVACQAVFQPQMTDFTAKRCELKLFGIAYFKGINDVVTDDVKVRKTYVDDKSLYTSGNFRRFPILYLGVNTLFENHPKCRI